MVARRWLILVSIVSVVMFILVWHQFSRNADPSLFPTPRASWDGAVELWIAGILWDSMWISVQRAMKGWLLGAFIGIPIGLAAGASRLFRAVVDPFIHFFRFVPALALISVFLLWFGIGESSKVNLVVYATAFVIIVSTAGGAAAVPTDKRDAARCLGASRVQVFLQVTVPSTVPAIFLGMRLALANAFLVIVAAEALGTRSGIGYLIWNSRTYFRTDHIFVGIVCLGVLGFSFDRVWRLVGRTILQRFLRREGNY
jgi:ABC-type nitrate/sulfonate/bicarbonate transport system permease component